MSTRRLGPLLAGWFSTVRGTALAAAFIICAFVGMHWLGLGEVRELFYTLLLIAFGLGFMATRSFVRYAARQGQLWDAQVHLPPDVEALPQAVTEPEHSFRELCAAYQRARNEEATAAATAQRERFDYFTLWVHQIKTPISALDLMAQSGETVDRELLRQEVFKIGQYADAALTFQRLQSLTNDLALTKVALYPLCASVVKRLRPIFLYRNIRLNMASFEGEALSDPKWLGMALMQVFSNALKYTPEGGCITVTLCEPQVLQVTDTGVGIRQEELPRVFDRGFTGQAGRLGGEGEKSTGIGLYLCKQAMDKLGHKVRLSSTPGQGLTVVFDLRREGFEDFS